MEALRKAVFSLLSINLIFRLTFLPRVLSMFQSKEQDMHKRFIIIAVLCSTALFSGCVSAPPRPTGKYSAAAADKAADTALAMVGRPYQYRGESPDGFDCSGLVRYSYLSAGVNLPHGTGSLRQRTVPVRSRDMRRGDLVFFDQSGKKYSHVGIYLGNGRFVHAPSSGKRVRTGSLDDPYWKKHFLGARRVS
jgi:cell wall-associated NlpC family hydrolase